MVSPPKTGSTWLAYNLMCHPDVFVPSGKEVKYFSSLYKWLDINWYARHFEEGAGRLKGEASPSYALLPRETIRRIRALRPNLKVIFLMRDPVARSWSHAKHNHRHLEANFRNSAVPLDSVSDQTWIENFQHPWPLHSGDYLSQLKRWLSVFPANQVYVDFYERIAAEPVALLSDIFRFLEVQHDGLNWSSFRASETIFAGDSTPLSQHLRLELQRVWRKQTSRLGHYVKVRFGLNIYDWWEDLGKGENMPLPATANDTFLEQLLETIDFNQSRLVEKDYYNHNIVFNQGRFYALPNPPANLPIDRMSAADLMAHGDEMPGESIQEVKDAITHRMIQTLSEEQSRLASSIAQLGAELRTEFRTDLAESQAFTASVRDSLSTSQQDFARQLVPLQRFITRLRESWVFRLRRWLAKWLCTPSQGDEAD